MLDYARDLARAGTHQAVWEVHCRTMQDFGFDRCIYGLSRNASTDGALGAFEDAMVLSNHPAAYNEAFLGSQMFEDSPGFRWARRNTGAIGWGALWNPATPLSERDRQHIAFQQASGVTAGITVSLDRTAPRTFAVVSLTARPGLSQADVDATWADEGCRIWTMISVMHLKILSLPHVSAGADLSERQREALEWVGEGKSYQDIATIMGVSMATVEKHLRLAREKLRVSTTAQAVLKAAFQNRIYRATPPALDAEATEHALWRGPCDGGPGSLTET